MVSTLTTWEGMPAMSTEDHLHLIDVLDQEVRDLAAELERVHRQVTQAVRRVLKGYRDGNIRALATASHELQERTSGLLKTAGDLLRVQSQVEVTPASLDAYARAFEAACRSERLPLEGDFPTYTVFPIEVQFHLDEQYVLVQGRTVSILRPSTLASYIRRLRDELYRAKFNAGRFRRALIQAHAILSGDNPTQPVPLKEIHRLLSLREGTGVSGYPLSQFAFDIYRVRRDGLVEGSKRLVFIEGRGRGQVISVPAGGNRVDNLTALQIQEVH